MRLTRRIFITISRLDKTSYVNGQLVHVVSVASPSDSTTGIQTVCGAEGAHPITIQ